LYTVEVFIIQYVVDMMIITIEKFKTGDIQTQKSHRAIFFRIKKKYRVVQKCLGYRVVSSKNQSGDRIKSCTVTD
jgi:hypothetical protein